MKQNRLEKHSKIILAVFVTTIMMIIVFGVEKYLALTNPVNKEITRHIRLKEQKLSTVRYVVPDDNYMKKTDSLIQKKYKFEIDKDGFIYPSRIHDNPDVNIFFLGGSSTECGYVEEQNRFPYLVGRLFENKRRKVNSFNSGVSGNDSTHSINILINKIIPLDPDIAIMMHNINDLNILLYEGSYWNNNPTRKHILYEKKKGLFFHLKAIVNNIIPNLYLKTNGLYRKTRPPANLEGEDEFAHIRGKKLNIDKRYLLSRFEVSLQMFINICRAIGAIPVLMTQANRFKENPDEILTAHWNLKKDFGITYSQYRDVYLAFNDSIRKIGKRSNILVIDLAGEVPQTKDYMYDAVHFNDNGSKFVAEIIANRLKQELMRQANEGVLK